MILLLATMLQAAAPALPAASPAVQPASSRVLNGRFSCDAIVYEVQVTATPLTGAGVKLDRITSGGRPIDAGALAEAQRMVMRLADVQSLDVRCSGDGDAALSIYGTQATTGAPPRRARLRATLRGTDLTGLSLGVEQR